MHTGPVLKWGTGWLKFRDLRKTGWKQTGVVNAERYGSFRGFDHQVDLESKLAGYVDYLVGTCRWEEQKEFLQAHGSNSRSETLPTYRSMLAELKPAWRKATRRGGRPHLSAVEISHVLLAAPGAQLGQDEGTGYDGA
ncbi:YfbU family protein [Corynebacterium flavescens]